ncbi:MAG: hypothetical protein JXN60_07065, partial [Lentisphaerae bacterium]|nr:hypothetical protein [Lentisphaerota bacterium]
MNTNAVITRIRNRLGPLGWGTLLVFFAYRLGDVAAVAAKVVLGRWLPDEDFGAIEPIFSVLAVMCVPITILFQASVKSISRLQEKAQTDEMTGLLRDLIKITCVGSVVSVATLFLFRRLILLGLHLPDELWIVTLIAGLFALAWWNPLMMAVLQGKQRYHMVGMFVGFGPFLVLALTIMFVGMMNMGLTGSLLARVVGSACWVGIVMALMSSSFRGRRGDYRAELIVLRGTLLPMSVFILFQTILMHCDRLFVRQYMISDSGGYGAIVTLGQIPLWLISPMIFVLFPLVSAGHVGGRDIRYLLRQAMIFGLVIGGTCILVLFFSSCLLFRLWKQSFVPYAGYVWIYTLVMVLHALTEVIARVELARNRYAF